jgi:hypothetical protein
MHRPASTLVFLLLAVLALTTARAAERLEQWTAPAGVAEFRLSTFRGQVTVEAAEDDVLRVEVRAEAASANPERAEARLEGIRMVWAAVGDWCTLDVSEPRESGVRFIWQERDPIGLEIRVFLPALRKLQIVSGEGGVRLGRITADVDISARRGLVSCALVQGNISVRVEEGGIVVSRATGAAHLRSELGDVSAGTIGGHARLFARSGDVELLAGKCSIEANSDGGNVTVGITPSLMHQSRIASAGGNVTLKIDPAARVSLDATTSWGKIRDRSPANLFLPMKVVSGGFGGKRLAARINYGGVEVQVHASGGNIDLVAAESLF